MFLLQEQILMSTYFPLSRSRLRVLFRSFLMGRRQTSQSGSPLLWVNQSLYSCITMTTISSISNNLAGYHFLMPFLRYPLQPVREDTIPNYPWYPRWPVQVHGIAMLVRFDQLTTTTSLQSSIRIWIQDIRICNSNPVFSISPNYNRPRCKQITVLFIKY